MGGCIEKFGRKESIIAIYIVVYDIKFVVELIMKEHVDGNQSIDHYKHNMNNVSRNVKIKINHHQQQKIFVFYHQLQEDVVLQYQDIIIISKKKKKQCELFYLWWMWWKWQ